MRKPAVQIAVAVIAALAIVVLTPAGDWLKEQLFPTKADVSGSVILDGQPAGVVQLMLDGEDAGSTNEQGAFLLEDVGDGEHTLTLRTEGPPAEGDHTFSVQQGDTEVNVGAITLNPLLKLGYVAQLQPGLGSIQYAITLWIHGDPEEMDRVRSVRYTLPAPLSGSVRRRNSAKAFCWRSEGELSVLEATTGSGSAMANVRLRNGETFKISAELPGQDQPPPCPLSPARQDDDTDTTDTDTTDTDTTDTDTTDTDTTPTPTPTVLVPDVIGTSEASARGELEAAGFQVAVVTAPSDTTAKGLVAAQSPAPGTEADEGSEVMITVSSGP